MTNPTPLTDNELRAVAFFAVGVTSEGSIGGRDMSYRLSFAGNVREDGTMAPVGNSGYSFGTLQIDLGQHPAVAGDLLDAYQRWAHVQPDAAALELDARNFAVTLAALQRTGRQMQDVQARDIDRLPMNRFLASDQGRTFVHGLDTEHVNSVARVDDTLGNRDSALERLQRTTLYRDSSDQDQARLAGLLMKLQNQSGARHTPGLLSLIERAGLNSADEVKVAINGLMRNAANGTPDYIESGADNTLRGVALFNALRATRADSPLNTAWSAVVANPLVGPVSAHSPNPAHPDLGLQYDTVRSLFLSPEGSQRMIRALEDGVTVAEGDPTPNANRRRSAGFFVAGNDFVHWNADGQGIGYVGGQWRSIDPDRLQRVANRDGTVDLRFIEEGRTTTLMHVDPCAIRMQRTPEPPAAHGAVDIVPARDTRLADDPSHDDFATFNRIHDWVRGTGQWDAESSRNVAAALYRAQAENPLVRRVDQIAGSRGRDGAENVFAVYAPHGDNGPLFVAQVDGRGAAQEPAEQSLAQAEHITTQRHDALQQERQMAVSRGIAL